MSSDCLQDFWKLSLTVCLIYLECLESLPWLRFPQEIAPSILLHLFANKLFEKVIKRAGLIAFSYFHERAGTRLLDRHPRNSD